MSKTKYILLVFFVMLVVFWAMLFGGNSILLYMDLPTFILVPIVPWLVASFIYSFKEQKEHLTAIFAKDECDEMILNRALASFNLIRNLTIGAALLACFTGIIGMLANLEDLASVGRNFGALLITVYYTAIYLLTVIEPLKGAIRKKLL